jgi:hypothetical protein
MKKILAALSLVALVALPVAGGDVVKGEWTGYITDTHCGEKGAGKDHTAGCVEKCMKAGSKAQLWNAEKKEAIDLDSFDKVKGLVGQKVTLKGTLDSQTGVIKVESAAAAKADAPK